MVAPNEKVPPPPAPEGKVVPTVFSMAYIDYNMYCEPLQKGWRKSDHDFSISFLDHVGTEASICPTAAMTTGLNIQKLSDIFTPKRYYYL